jgi:transcriptional regulator with XRE-family HTH domain
MTEERFGSRLKRERERRHIALSSISANTKINAALFEALERDDVSRWPSGIFRRAFIRAYAEGIGLDPDAVAREFNERFPDPEQTCVATPDVKPAITTHANTVLRLTLADSHTPFIRGRVIPDMRRRWAAVASDACVAVAIAALVFLACGKFWAPLSMTALGYYLGGILLLGNTPGVCMWGRASEQTAIAVAGTKLPRWMRLISARLSSRASRVAQ